MLIDALKSGDSSHNSLAIENLQKIAVILINNLCTEFCPAFPVDTFQTFVNNFILVGLKYNNILVAVQNISTKISNSSMYKIPSLLIFSKSPR